MPTDVKTKAIVALTRRVNATGRDLDAARLLSRCALKIRAVESRGLWGAVGNPAADVTVHADHETLIEARRTGAVERVRRAVREALGDTPLHRIQWVEAAKNPAAAAAARRAAAAAAAGRAAASRPRGRATANGRPGGAPAGAPGNAANMARSEPPVGGTPIMAPTADAPGPGRKAG